MLTANIPGHIACGMCQPAMRGRIDHFLLARIWKLWGRASHRTGTGVDKEDRFLIIQLRVKDGS